MNLSTPSSRATLYARIGKWLDEERMSDGGGWAPCSENDLVELYEIIYEMVALKFQRDADGDLPVQAIVINRTKYQCMYWMRVPHMSENPDIDELLDLYDIAHINTSMANGNLDQAWKMLNYIRNREKKE